MSGRVILCLGAVIVLLSGSECSQMPADPVTTGAADDRGDGPSGELENRPPRSVVVAPDAAVVQGNVTVQNFATDPDGDRILRYRFRTTFDDFMQSASSAVIQFPEPGTQPVFVSAQDDRQVWGAEASKDIVVAGAPGERILFIDDGTAEPVDLGYFVTYPDVGTASVVTANGRRTMKLRESTSSLNYGMRSDFRVPRGAHVRFRARLAVETDPLWEVASDDYGYAIVQLEFGRDGESLHANYLVLARNDLLSEGFPGSPPKLESYFKPGKDVFDRQTNGAWAVMDIDLDRLVETRFDSRLNLASFNTLWWYFTVRDVRGRGQEYRMTLELDEFMIYVPEP